MPRATADIFEWVHGAAKLMEMLAVASIVVVVIVATFGYLVRVAGRSSREVAYHLYRRNVARALLLGLELLVAADVIGTVVLEPTMDNVLALGLLVIIRTFL